jgi:predicted NUDIX family phosphoesterase
MKMAAGFGAELLELFSGFPGVISEPEAMSLFRARVVPRLEFRDRFDVEKDPRFKQVIPYVVILGGTPGTVWAYRRSNKGGEARLHGQWSIGVGGHMEGQDHSIDMTAYRELEEEFRFVDSPSPSTLKRVGLLYSDATPVDQVHFGVVYAAQYAGKIVPHDDEIEEVRLVQTRDLEDLPLESWSKLVYEALLKTGKVS